LDFKTPLCVDMLNKRHVCYEQLAILQLHDHNEKNTMGPSMVGVPHLKQKDSLLGIHLFCHKTYDKF